MYNHKHKEWLFYQFLSVALPGRDERASNENVWCIRARQPEGPCLWLCNSALLCFGTYIQHICSVSTAGNGKFNIFALSHAFVTKSPHYVYVVSYKLWSRVLYYIMHVYQHEYSLIFWHWTAKTMLFIICYSMHVHKKCNSAIGKGFFKNSIIYIWRFY
jgi:hypothetical protein